MPNLTSKELTALEDLLNNEMLAIKKSQAFAAQFTDPVLKSKCEQIANTHQQHYQKLLKFLG